MYNDEGCLPYNWYKVMKYSVRCVKNISTDVPHFLNKSNLKIINPVGDKLQLIYNGIIDIKSVEIFNMQGQLMKKEVFGSAPKDINLQGIKQGIYIAEFFRENEVIICKFNKTE
jgi:hypothetical protein